MDSNTTSRHSPSYQWLLLVVFIISLIGALPFVVTEGGISEFSPDTLDSRFQSEWLVKEIQVPVYRSSYTKYRYQLVQYLIDKGYWIPRKTPNPKWLPMNHWNWQWKDGHTILHWELTRNSKELIEWTENNPEMATLVWPVVLKTIRQHESKSSSCYVGNLLWHAKNSSTIEELSERIKRDPEMQGFQLCIDK